jgi:hypothetical protein
LFSESRTGRRAKTGTDREPVFPHKKSIVEKTAARPLVIYRRFFFVAFICGTCFYPSSLFAAAAFIRFLYLWSPPLFAFFICGRRLYPLSLFVAAAFFHHLYLQSFVVLHFTKLISAR